MACVHDFEVTKLDGQRESLQRYRGHVLLIVNTASRCGFTPQYEGLEALRQRYRDQRFEVLAFPCNQFAHQEPGDSAAIASFCETRFQTSFPIFAKVKVNGRTAQPLFDFLKRACPGILGSTAIKWNFTKFLVDRSGKPIRRFSPRDEPNKLGPAIEAALRD